MPSIGEVYNSEIFAIQKLINIRQHYDGWNSWHDLQYQQNYHQLRLILFSYIPFVLNYDSEVWQWQRLLNSGRTRRHSYDSLNSVVIILFCEFLPL